MTDMASHCDLPYTEPAHVVHDTQAARRTFVRANAKPLSRARKPHRGARERRPTRRRSPVEQWHPSILPQFALYGGGVSRVVVLVLAWLAFGLILFVE
jgi:hypothetical protein